MKKAFSEEITYRFSAEELISEMRTITGDDSLCIEQDYPVLSMRSQKTGEIYETESIVDLIGKRFSRPFYSAHWIADEGIIYFFTKFEVPFESLNEIYTKNALHYWCNATGDINLPGQAPAPHIYHKVDELPTPQLKDLYKNVWGEDGPCLEYVVTLDGTDGYVFGYLLDETWMKDSGINEKGFADVVRIAAENIFRNAPELCGCRVLFGDKTDPDGSEVLIFYPYEKREQIVQFSKALAAGKFDLWDEICRVAHENPEI